MKMPKLSIVTPSFNQGQFLEETILSVLNQEYPDLEYIIIDGGSTDNSIEIIKKYADSLSYWASESDNGQSDAINKGFRKATGEIVTWLCADDTYYPGSLETITNLFSKNPNVDVFYGDIASVDKTGRIFAATRSLNFSRLALFSRIGSLPQPASFFRRRILDDIGYIDETAYYAMDYEFFLRAAASGKSFEHIQRTLATYRYHNCSKTVTGIKDNNVRNEEIEKHQKKYGTVFNYSLNLLKIARIIYKFKHILLNIDRYWKYRQNYLNRIMRANK